MPQAVLRPVSVNEQATQCPSSACDVTHDGSSTRAAIDVDIICGNFPIMLSCLCWQTSNTRRSHCLCARRSAGCHKCPHALPSSPQLYIVARLQQPHQGSKGWNNSAFPFLIPVKESSISVSHHFPVALWFMKGIAVSCLSREGRCNSTGLAILVLAVPDFGDQGKGQAWSLDGTSVEL